MENWKDDWKGTKKEQISILESVLKDIKDANFKELSDKDFNKLFAEAIYRNLVISELTEMMCFIYNDGIMEDE